MLKMIINRYKRLLYNKKNVKVGKNTRILTNWLNFGSEPYLIEIGDNCVITSGVKFITHDASISTLFNYIGEKREVNNEQYTKMNKIKIKDNCMIGVNSLIMQGVTIGSNSIIGAGSVVTKDVPEGVVVAGNPAKEITTIDKWIEKTKPQLIKIIKPNDKKDILSKIERKKR